MAAPNQPHVIELTLPNGQPVIVSGVQSLNKTNYFKFEFHKKSAYLEQGVFVTAPHEARKQLHGWGLSIVGARPWNELVAAVGEVGDFVPDRLTDRPGWTDRYFTSQFGKVYSPKGETNARATFRTSSKAAAKGTFRSWKRKVARLLTGQNLPIIAVLAGLAGPCLAIVGESQNFGFEFWGKPESGKSTCLRLMKAVSGDPADLPNFNSTLAGLETLFASHNDVGFPVDEANLASRGGEFMTDFAFRMANGTTRLTAFQPGQPQSRFVFGTTSNQPFYDGLRKADRNIADAALQRLIPLHVPPDNPLGVFDRLPKGFTTSGALAAYINDAIGMSYGRPLSRMLKALVNARAADAAGLRAKMLEHIRVFETIVGVSQSERGTTRVSHAFGLLYAVGEFAKAHKILPSAWDCMAACVAGYRNYQAQLPDHTPVTARLSTIAQRPETLDLREGPLPDLSDEDLERHGAFIHCGRGGRIELLLTEVVQREFFPDWTALQHALDRDPSFLRERGRRQLHRTIRRCGDRKRFFCFVLFPEVAGGLTRL
ncbi:DUF927 domain-containing protein [Sphingomonas turrisvirgatae]|uniref:DUF927 domain-containing protein n=1 Tax=Sphingomonas turrisvirgatae TaxID=1888892 RepID=A0A1E3LTN8_9SPHN|nr:DUF927 domain-containing protein [Sphingomonas turrisvirgatae]ODP37107.1 hypothetical protein BFL28_18635 [Sphingomonas turrisvirgatae]